MKTGLRLYIYRNSDGQYLPKSNDTSLIIKTNHLNCSFKINSQKNYVHIIEFKSNTLLSILRLIQLFQYYLQFTSDTTDSLVLFNNNNRIIETSTKFFFVENNKIITSY